MERSKKTHTYRMNVFADFCCIFFALLSIISLCMHIFPLYFFLHCNSQVKLCFVLFCEKSKTKVEIKNKKENGMKRNETKPTTLYQSIKHKQNDWKKEIHRTQRLNKLLLLLRLQPERAHFAQSEKSSQCFGWRTTWRVSVCVDAGKLQANCDENFLAIQLRTHITAKRNNKR